VQSVHFREGSLVKVGDLLVSIDPAPYAADADRAQAQVVAAQARVTYVKSEHERAQRLWDESAIAKRELDERANARHEAEANLRAAESGAAVGAPQPRVHPGARPRLRTRRPPRSHRRQPRGRRPGALRCSPRWFR
jgi:multidrug efflux pump subunit AcrA (membrane-fusion protein)